jgi:CDP-diacylglycerol--glycerol-3-phosphate 3-phosphatidyltransferase
MSNKNKPRTDKGPRTISNGMSLLRLLLAIPIALLFGNPYGNQLALLGIGLLAYALDLGDGFVARVRNEKSDIGRILDPLADKVVVLTFMIGLMVTRLLPYWFVGIVIGRDVFIFLAGIYLKKKTGVLVESNMMGKAAVVSVMVVILLAVFQQDFSKAALQLFMILSLGLMAASLYTYGERFLRLMRQQSKK